METNKFSSIPAVAYLTISDEARANGYDLSLYQKGNENVTLGDFGSNARKLYEMEKISEGHYLELLNQITDEKQ